MGEFSILTPNLCKGVFREEIMILSPI